MYKVRMFALVLVLLFAITAALSASAPTVTRCSDCRATPTATFESRFTPTFTPPPWRITPTFTPDTGRITPTPTD